MIAQLTGTIQHTTENSIILKTPSGVGYLITLTPETISTLDSGAETTLYTYLKVAENALELFGFISLDQQNFFKLLLTVSGVGPKSAMNVLALGSIDQIKDAISRKDVKYLTAVQGMGKKTAERLCVELQSKVGTLPTSTSGTSVAGSAAGSMAEVVEGLTALGYSTEEAREAVQQLDPTDLSSEVLLRKALQILAT